eukprot:TRINITY_DN65134_c0_g1_i1.p2 TRINITY_DN65134_c0_g1~~TRINITY_DN65134_c0_g1_i1.p2  ORF type:complete len:141 (+),score=48.31 TRINITY_DN65134_c0_g1_i1:55-477(+)
MGLLGGYDSSEDDDEEKPADDAKTPSASTSAASALPKAAAAAKVAGQAASSTTAGAADEESDDEEESEEEDAPAAKRSKAGPLGLAAKATRGSAPVARSAAASSAKQGGSLAFLPPQVRKVGKIVNVNIDSISDRDFAKS